MLSRQQVRSVDQIAMDEFQMSGLVLMENAGRGAAEVINDNFPQASELSPRRAVILCGGGNNGGDGYVIARHLELMAWTVKVISMVPLQRLQGDAAANAKIAQLAKIPISEIDSVEALSERLDNCGVIVDCLLGTGATGAPRGIYGDAIRLANELSAKRVAIDLPTGMDCDRGEPSEPTFRADLTVTFVDFKLGFENPMAKKYLGDVHVVGIGVPNLLLNRFPAPF